ncbi:MAG: flagellar hook assembly protein FlgD [Betaproteobacteria bacterium]|jgi:flagellar basal-body rod modification protein FlgD|nr:flagellar hook assembly protein FlgD [Rhodocyclaceae bacterium]MCA3135284.1 flagellar hook assembly protein FlgD [Rhodocyclaceae bacterium]MCA3141666.1 flagellar hook assembly protein FlgD [Rhodocyclaceae bacterium]MCA3145316.1 flagellar hook assembly protein FlgD [Rhodocyclaceae bacterium]MCE2896810.1 flagellar hook assembly protein FlgD [Betaproteobacteria bacterium]
MTTTIAATAANTAAPGNADALRLNSGDPQERFLKLLVSQLRNQDPLNPLQNSEVTSQIAQISTVNGIERLNGAVQNMGANMLSAQSLQASSMIGRGVLAEGNRIQLSDGEAVGGFELAGPADKVVVTILDSGGHSVESLDLGRKTSGLSTFAWDGRPGEAQLADGTYSFKVEALRDNGTKVAVTTLGYGRVQSVSLDNGVILNTPTLGALALSSVRQIL